MVSATKKRKMAPAMRGVMISKPVTKPIDQYIGIITNGRAGNESAPNEMAGIIIIFSGMSARVMQLGIHDWHIVIPVCKMQKSAVPKKPVMSS